MSRKLLTIKKCEEIYGISRISLINYEKKGLIASVRTLGGIRRYRVEDVERILGIIRKENYNNRKTILYPRVSTRKQVKKSLSAFGVEIVIINGDNEEKEKTAELAEDLVAIATSFTGKIYGKRGSKNKRELYNANLNFEISKIKRLYWI